MKMFNLNSRLARRATAILALGLLLGAQTAMACTVDNWNGGNSGNVTPGGPGVNVARYSGLCAMETAASAAAWVQDNSPGGIDRIRARFYVRNALSSFSVIYRGFSTTGGTGTLVTVFLNAAGTVTLRDESTGTQLQQTSATEWISIEIDWSQTAGDGFMSLSVNGQTPVEQTGLANAGSALQSVRLGNLNGATGILGFDAYESRRTTEIGRLLACDAQPDDSVNILDALAVINEINEVSLATGQPDCSENGSVDILDVLDIINIINT